MIDSNGIIRTGTSGGVTYGVSIGDLQTVLGTTKNDDGQIISDVDLAECAKYKPVRHSKLGLLTLADRASARYGFDPGLPPRLALTDNVPQNDWVYLRPRGRTQNEWFRRLDFDGYSHGACSPLAMMVGQLVYDGESQIILFGEGMSNGVRDDGRKWVGDQSLSISELLESGSQDVYGYYISFILVDTSDYAKCLIVTNRTARRFAEDDYGNSIVKLYAQGGSDGGLTCPAIPLLSSSRAGHTFEVIVCLLPGNNPLSGNAYAVYDADTQGFLDFRPYSLGFEQGSDRTQASLGSGTFSMDGTQVTGLDVIVTDTYIEETVAGQVYHAYSLEIRATISTMNAQAYGGDMAISGMLSFSTGGAFGPTAAEATSRSFPDPGVAVGKLASKTAGQDRMIWSSGGVNYMWLPKYNGTVVRTSLGLSVDFSYPFSAGNHATRSDTFYIPS